MGTVPVGRKKRTDVTGGPQTFRSPTAVVVWWVWLLFAAANLIDLAVQGRDHLSLVAAAILLLATGVAYAAAQRPRILADSSGLTVVNPFRDYHIGWAGVTKVDLADLLRVHCQVQGRDKIIYAWAVHYSRRRKLAADAKALRQAARANSGRSTFGTFGLGGGYGSGSGVGRRELGYASPPAADPASSAEADAERISRILNEYVTAARAETVWAEGTVEIAGASPSARPAPEPGSEPRPNPGSEPGPEPAGSEPAGAIDTAGDATADPRIAGWHEPLTSTWDRTALLALLIPALILLIVAVA
jgi:hypothetical protein